MATVRITHELKDRVEAAARGLFSKRLEALKAEPVNRGDPKIGDEMLANWLSQQPYNDIWERIPEDWKIGPQDTVVIKSICGVPFGQRVSITRQFLPPEKSRYGRTEEPQLDITDPTFQHLIEKWEKWRADEAALNEEINTTVRTARDFLDQHTTLRKALTEWPQLWELLPQDVRDEHNRQEPKVKTTRAEAAGIDINILTGAVVKAKFVENGGS